MRKHLLTLSAAVVVVLQNAAASSWINTQCQNFHFKNSKQKDKGKRYILHLNYQKDGNGYAFAYAKTKTKTFQPPMKDDLDEDKLFFKYTKSLSTQKSLSFSYGIIHDNLTYETDGGKIYGIGYHYQKLKLTQYLSDYKHFNVYQTDLAYKLKHNLHAIRLQTTFLTKYMYLQDRKSNRYTQKAKASYFTTAMIFKAKYQDYYSRTGLFLGERLFAVMQDGFSVQHRAMEFDRTYFFEVGKQIKTYTLMLKYLYMHATEVPIENKNVSMKDIIVSLTYHF